jgi:hypothetical protein
MSPDLGSTLALASGVACLTGAFTYLGRLVAVKLRRHSRRLRTYLRERFVRPVASTTDNGGQPVLAALRPH